MLSALQQVPKMEHTSTLGKQDPTLSFVLQDLPYMIDQGRIERATE